MKRILIGILIVVVLVTVIIVRMMGSGSATPAGIIFSSKHSFYPSP